ncbi:hypothetical protein BFO01nite_22470 [Brevibacillus formosus]|uniref:Uncharacterized protein n=1 Tax=Brevibacillus formosus TaxID=54913 RepID=A0ABQ0T459_9BACL|nr:hypothetical protein BFO01nite_22470 [Brevibacillus formosus]
MKNTSKKSLKAKSQFLTSKKKEAANGQGWFELLALSFTFTLDPKNGVSMHELGKKSG